MEQRSLFNVERITVNGNVAIHNHAGRPTIDPEQDRSEHLKARFTPNEKELIAKYCRRHRCTVTEFIRESARLGYRYKSYADVLDRDDIEEFLERLLEHVDALSAVRVRNLIFDLLETVGKKF